MVVKEADCHSDSMEAYCQEVRKLEHKFDGLELRHVPRRHNEVADALAKMGSLREAVPTGVFADDQYKPSVRPSGNPVSDSGAPELAETPATDPPDAPADDPSGPEVMEIEEDAVDPR